MPDTGRGIRAGANVAAVARQYDVATSLIYKWRRMARACETGFAEVSWFPMKLSPLRYGGATSGDRAGDRQSRRDCGSSAGLSLLWRLLNNRELSNKIRRYAPLPISLTFLGQFVVIKDRQRRGKFNSQDRFSPATRCPRLRPRGPWRLASPLSDRDNE
ncbi:hypothetical protein [Mesorhizobium sp. WSM4312]|uniref:hypothetical protein n=1 Tax=Mesorhizobium sp. WSM4312 TaxID=2029411 RepID=UPI001AECA8BE|nr:hypothetical protein [Mesorhizobium sp. WSM4312]